MEKQKTLFIGLLLLGLSLNTFANESERLDRLEKELQQLKARVSKLDGEDAKSSNTQETVSQYQGWKSLSNWRKLANDMTTSDVQKLLGEPDRVNGGKIATWYYQHGGAITFMDGKVYQWTEPRK